MKKLSTTLLLLFTVLMAFKANAQDDKDKPLVKSYISISAGITQPMGDFKSFNYGNYLSGFANRGMTYNIDAGFRIYNNLSLTTMLSIQDHGQLNAAAETNLSNGWRTDYNDYEATVTGSNRYTSINLMLGPQYSFLFGKHLTVDLRALGGVTKSISTPEIDVTLLNYEDKSDSFTQYSTNSFKLAYGGGVGIRYNLTDGFGFVLRETYLSTLGLGYNIENSPRTTTLGRVQTRMPVQEAQTTLGVVFNL